MIPPRVDGVGRGVRATHSLDGEEIRVKIRSNSHYRIWNPSISRNAHRLILANILSGSGGPFDHLGRGLRYTASLFARFARGAYDYNRYRCLSVRSFFVFKDGSLPNKKKGIKKL